MVIPWITVQDADLGSELFRVGPRSLGSETSGDAFGAIHSLIVCLPDCATTLRSRRNRCVPSQRRGNRQVCHDAAPAPPVVTRWWTRRLACATARRC